MAESAPLLAAALLTSCGDETTSDGSDRKPADVAGEESAQLNPRTASFAVLDAYVEAGGNVIDTANIYSWWGPGNSGGESETIVGRWLAGRGSRRERQAHAELAAGARPAASRLDAAAVQLRQPLDQREAQPQAAGAGPGVACEQVDRAQRFGGRQVAETELADHVIAAGLGELGGEELRDGCGRSGDALAACDQGVVVGWARVHLRAAVQPEQMREARVPDRIGAARDAERLERPQAGSRTGGCVTVPPRAAGWGEAGGEEAWPRLRGAKKRVTGSTT